MFIKLLFVFISVPLLELYVLLQIGRWLGALPTIALVIVTAICGSVLMRSEGLLTLQRIQLSLQQGQMPTEELLDGLLILLGGLCLLTPGFCTDLFGLSLLLPWSRPLLKSALRRLLERHLRGCQIEIRLP